MSYYTYKLYLLKKKQCLHENYYVILVILWKKSIFGHSDMKLLLFDFYYSKVQNNCLLTIVSMKIVSFLAK